MRKIIDLIAQWNKSTKILVAIILALIILFMSIFIPTYKQYSYYKNTRTQGDGSVVFYILHVLYIRNIVMSIGF